MQTETVERSDEDKKEEEEEEDASSLLQTTQDNQREALLYIWIVGMINLQLVSLIHIEWQKSLSEADRMTHMPSDPQISTAEWDYIICLTTGNCNA